MGRRKQNNSRGISTADDAPDKKEVKASDTEEDELSPPNSTKDEDPGAVAAKSVYDKENLSLKKHFHDSHDSPAPRTVSAAADSDECKIGRTRRVCGRKVVSAANEHTPGKKPNLAEDSKQEDKEDIDNHSKLI